MSVKLLDNEAFYGYRVRRTVDAKLYQEYFSLKKNGKRLTGAPRKRVQNAADRRDRELAGAQQKSRQENKAERCFNRDGSVRGISYLVKTEKSGTRTPIFQVGIASELNGKIICTSYSINAHGESKAWRMAVETFASHKGIGKGTKLYKQLLAAIPARTPTRLKAGKKAQAKGKAKGKVKGKRRSIARKSVRSIAKQAVKKAGKRTGKKSVKKAAKKAAKKITRKAAGESPRKAVRKAVKKAVKKAIRKVAKKKQSR
ncbi:MAG: hypothetical protein WBN40_08290 [Pseudomonadales bacterium]